MTTDTPLTDAKAAQLQHDTLVRGVDWRIIVYKALQHGYQLERELSASKAEVERLQSQLERAVEIAEEFRQVKWLHYQCNCNMCNKLSELKKELK